MRLAEAVRALKPSDVNVLRALAKASRSYRYVPLDVLQEMLRISPSVLEKRLSFLHRLGLIRRWIGQYRGYELKSIGLDALALYTLSRRGFIEALGPKLGVGKEAEVYEAITPSGERVAVKFHRAGRRSFKHVRKVRTYLAGVKGSVKTVAPLIAAKREFEALELTHREGIAVPRPIVRVRHAVVTSFIEGELLYMCRELPNPSGLLSTILDNVVQAYRKAGVIHGDLSEYNVVVTPSLSPLIIDWPQWVPSSHPLAFKLLIRDIEYVASFFRRRFNVMFDLSELYKKLGQEV